MALYAKKMLSRSREEAAKKHMFELRHGQDLTRRTSTWNRLQGMWGLQDHVASDEVLCAGNTRTTTFPGFAREVFSRLYTGDHLDKIGHILTEHRWATRMHSLLDDLPEWSNLIQRCHGDSYATTAATVGLLHNIIDQIPQHKYNANEARKMRDLFRDEWDKTSPRKPVSLMTAETALEKAEREADGLVDSIDESATRQAMRVAIKSISEQFDETDAAACVLGWSLYGSGQPRETSAKEKSELAARLINNTKLKQILVLAGRMVNIMREVQATKIRHGASEIVDIEIGSAIERYLPSELMLLSQPLLKMLFAKRFHEKSALQYRLDGKEKIGKGPIIVCVDDSGSMAGVREMWSKAIAIALLNLSRRQKRSFAFCAFTTCVMNAFTEYEQKQRRKDLSKIIDMLMFHAGGGTNFDAPLTWAFDLISTKKDEESKKSDIIFITDGACKLDSLDTIMRRKKESETRIYGVLLGVPGTTRETEIGRFSDRVWCLTESDLSQQSINELGAARSLLSL